MMKCTKAIIAVGGFGVRRLPITKTIEKCMLPVGNRPIVDYAVEGCIQAGIKEIILTVNGESDQVRSYYTGSNKSLEQHLNKFEKLEELAQLKAIGTKADFSFVNLDHSQTYGTSVPIWQARDHIADDEGFLYIYGDNIFYREDGGSAIADFVDEIRSRQLTSALMAVPVPLSQVELYGIVDVESKKGQEYYKRIVEKPKASEAPPSNLNNAGCFFLNSSVLPFVKQSIDSPSPEKRFTDALNWYFEAGNQIGVIRCSGEYLDAGTLEGWLYANNRIFGPS